MKNTRRLVLLLLIIVVIKHLDLKTKNNQNNQIKIDEASESELFFRYHRGLCTKAEKDEEVEKNGSEAYRLQFLILRLHGLWRRYKLTVDELGYKKN